MAASNKFTVVKFTKISEQEKNPYKCVPTFWINYQNPKDVAVLYPSEDQLLLGFDRIINGQFALAEWDIHPAIIICDAETYQAGLHHIKRLSLLPLDEETLMMWKQTRLKYKQNIKLFHPVRLFDQLWFLFWKFVSQ